MKTRGIMVASCLLVSVFSIVCVLSWYKNNIKDVQHLRHWVAVKIIPNDFTLGFDGIGKWYDHNGCFIYTTETFIILKDKRQFGFGIRPIGRIIDCVHDNGPFGDYYVVEMETDTSGNFFDYSETGKVNGHPTRTKEVQKHFKLNIEHCFKRIA